MSYQYATSRFPSGRLLPSTILGIALIALMGFSYFNARSLEDPR